MTKRPRRNHSAAFKASFLIHNMTWVAGIGGCKSAAVITDIVGINRLSVRSLLYIGMTRTLGRLILLINAADKKTVKDTLAKEGL